jgi:RNA polymerase sigma factor (sigma-70 family)
LNAAVATVFVVDDDGSTRELLTFLMKRNDLAVEAFADARSFLAAYGADRPGCLVLDLNMPGMSGLDLQQYLKEQGVLLPVIFLSGRADIPKAVQAVREGAIDFIEKPFDYKHVLERVRDCLERDRVARAGRDRKRVVSERLQALTQREREVLDLVVTGKLNREIAEALDISIKTVEAHRARLMEKLEVDSVAGLVQVVVAAG